MPSNNDRPARLKSLELQGYKTFATKTEFAFAPTITAVVGPNGTGKSNIADAIRWVLGEQSFSLLRGKKTEDMIFSGSDSRPRASMASVSITFDNSNGWLPIEFSEVSIGRRAYRDGQNEYLLNGQRVRLRDVHELLASCGLGERTYTIIGQGTVDAALSLRADERRRLFEEAAGIGLYRLRRKEALRRLEATVRNIERAQDIVAELKPRLRRLEGQAKRAEAYATIRKEVNEDLRHWYGYHWHQAHSKLLEVRHRAKSQGQLRDELLEQYEVTDSQLASARRRMDSMRSDIHTLSLETTSLYGDREVRGRRLAVGEERLRWLQEQEGSSVAEIEAVQDRIDQLVIRLKAAESEFSRRKAAQAQVKKDLAQIEQQGELSPERRQALLDQISLLRGKLEAIAAEQASREARLSEHKDRIQALEGKRDKVQDSLTEAVAIEDRTRKQFEDAGKSNEGAQRIFSQAKKEVEALRAKVQEMEQSQQLSAERLTKLRSNQASLFGRLEGLRQESQEIERTLASLQRATKEGELAGLVGQLEGALKIEPAHDVAIRTALGDLGQGVAFDSLEHLDAALAWFDSQPQEGKAAFLPLSPLGTASIVKTPDDPGCIGNASDLVVVKSRFRALMRMLLGRTLVASDRAAARRLLPDLPADGRVVTLAGEVFHASGMVLIGAQSSGSKIRVQVKKLEKKQDQLDQKIASASKESDQLAGSLQKERSKLGQAEKAFEIAQRQAADERLGLEVSRLSYEEASRTHKTLAKQHAELEGELKTLWSLYEALKQGDEVTIGSRADIEDELAQTSRQIEILGGASALAQSEERLEAARGALEDAQQRKQEIALELELLSSDLERRSARLRANREEQAKLKSDIEKAQGGVEEIENRLAEVAAKRQPLEDGLAAAEENRTSLERQLAKLRKDLQRAEQSTSQAQIELARREEELASLKRRILDDFGLVSPEEEPEEFGQPPLPFEGLVKKLPKVVSLPVDFEVHFNHRKAQLRRMGPVNLEALEEHDELRERVEFLTSQLDDLRKADAQLREVIGELDKLMETEFRRTFEQVGKHFREAFKRLFGGGSAKLVLSEGEDLESTGIDIEARLPGRREQGLAMLSGGERSLTASALIFSLLKVSPTPFCVLDEVDAMLDEANLERLSDMLRELSIDTQFIVITHARPTVQAADIVYGVSMGADQTSRIISLSLEEAAREIAGQAT